MRSRYRLARYAGWRPSVVLRLLPESLVGKLFTVPNPVYVKDQKLTLRREGNDGIVFPIDSIKDLDHFTAMSDFHVYAAGVSILHAENSYLPQPDSHVQMSADPCTYLHCQMDYDSDPLSEDGIFHPVIMGHEDINTPSTVDLLMHCSRNPDGLFTQVLRLYR